MKDLLIWMIDILPFKKANSFILNVYRKTEMNSCNLGQWIFTQAKNSWPRFLVL